MNMFAFDRQRLAGSWAVASLLGMLTVVSLFGATADSALAQKKRKPTPTPTVITAPPPQVIQIVAAEANRVIVTIDPGSGYTTEGEYVSGPLQPGGDIVGSPRPQALNVDGGQTWLTNLVPNSDYVFRFRRTYFFNSTTSPGQTVTSPYTNFAFRTPTLEQSRPSAPVISLTEVTNTILVSWAPSIDNVSTQTQINYFYSLNGGALQTNCGSYCFGDTGLRINRPAPGSKLVVFAVDGAGIQSLPSNEIVIP
jgi:hypothetical protein